MTTDNDARIAAIIEQKKQRDTERQRVREQLEGLGQKDANRRIELRDAWQGKYWPAFYRVMQATQAKFQAIGVLFNDQDLKPDPAVARVEISVSIADGKNPQPRKSMHKIEVTLSEIGKLHIRGSTTPHDFFPDQLSDKLIEDHLVNLVELATRPE